MREFLDSQKAVFPPEVIELLLKTFDDAWSAVQECKVSPVFESGSMDAREILAKAIIASAAGGERNPHRLRENAIGCLAKTMISRITHSATIE